jgi:outer membrane protein TolC
VPIETAGKRGHRVTHAKELSESARLNIATTAWQVRSRLRLSLLDWSSARQHETLLGQQLAIAEKIATQLEQRFQAGAISSFELTSARIGMAKVQVELEDFRRRTIEASARVAEAIGVPASALAKTSIEFGWDFAASAELASSEMREDALHSRPDILAALADYAASQSALQLQLAKQYPDIQLGTGYQWDQGESKWALGVAMELPVFNRNQGPIAEAEAKRTEAAARFEAVQAKALAEIDRAAASYRGAQGNLATVEKLMAAQKKQQEAIAAQLKAGAADQLEALNAQAELLATEVLRLDTRARAMDALGQLEDAMQRPFDALSSIEQSPRMTTQNRNP